MKNQFTRSFLGSLRSSTILTNTTATVGMLAVAFGSSTAFALDENALPTGGKVSGGSATFSQSGNKLNVKQTSNRAVIDWRSYDIGKNAHVNYDQPNSASIAVNRVNPSANASRIAGGLTSNGQVWILNANGVVFSRTAKIDVAGLVASTGNINSRRFMAGDTKLILSDARRGSVINEGQITIKEGGLAALVAPHVRNSGVIRASLGKVVLAAGETFTLDLAGDHLIEIGLGSDSALVEQLGDVMAAGGQIEISAEAASDLVDSVINLDGHTSAASATIVGGKIILGGDQLTIAGTLDASGTKGGGEILVSGDRITTEATADINIDALETGDGGTFIAYADELGQYAGNFSAQGGTESGDGGFIETSGKSVKIADDISVNTLAAAGETGAWSIDPDDLTVIASGGDGSSTIGADTIVSNLETTDVSLSANESITVDAEIDSSSQTSSSTLSLEDENSDGVLTVNLNADINLGSQQSLEGDASIVNISNGADIQDGVDVAEVSAQINVAAGDYRSFATATDGPVDVSILGSDGATITRDPTRGHSGVAHLRADGTTLDGFTIVGDGTKTGVSLVGQNITVSNNDISNVLTGIQTQSASVEGNSTITENTISDAGYGISLQNNSNTVTGNVVEVETEGFGIGSSGNIFADNIVSVGDEGVILKVYTTEDYDVLPGGEVDLLDFIDSNTLEKGVYITDGTDITVQTIFAGIQAAINAADAGNTIEALAGTYALSSSLNISKSLSLAGLGEEDTILDASSVSGYGINVSANDVSLSDFTLYGPSSDASSSYGIKVSTGGAASSRLTNFEITDVTIRGSGRAELDLNGVNGAQINNVTADGRSLDDDSVLTNGAGIQITDSANVTVSGSTTFGNAWGGVAIYQANRSFDQQTTNINIDVADSDFQEANGLYSQDSSDSNDFGTLNLSNVDYAIYNGEFRADGSEFTFYQTAEQAAVDFATSLGSTDDSFIRGWNGTESTDVYTVGTATDGTAMSIYTAVEQANAGSSVEVLAGTYGEDVVDNKAIAFSFEDTVLNGLTLNTSGTSLQGEVTTTQNGIEFDVAIILDGNANLTADEGGISVQDIDGRSAGGQTLSLSSTGTISAGSLGSTTRLGATIVDGNGTTLKGDQYMADSLGFSGPVILTQTSTEFNTVQSDSSAGDITFAGNIFASNNGAQDAVFTAGSGVGEASANGSISLQNAGTEKVKLGELSVTGDDFAAATVYLADGFTSVQTGDQTFTEQTLNADGDVDSDVGGSITGPIISSGTVDITAGIDISGSIIAKTVMVTATTGAVTASIEATDGTATVTAGTINGAVTAGTVNLTADTIVSDVVAYETASITANDSYTGSVEAGSAVIMADTIEAEVSGGTVTIDANSGTVDGNPNNLIIVGNGVLTVNNETFLAGSEAEIKQYVVTDFELPQKTYVAPSGNIVTPSGISLAAISPAVEGVAPKVTVVQNVQTLGSLLEQGYTAIVLDLNQNSAADMLDINETVAPED